MTPHSVHVNRGNVITVELASKRIQLLKEAVLTLAGSARIGRREFISELGSAALGLAARGARAVTITDRENRTP